MRNAYIQTLFDLTKEQRNIYCFVSDNGAIVFDKYREAFPENFVNFGIAESTMVSVAAGMASCGNMPFIYTIIPFLIMRAYEQIRNDLCMQRMNVKIVGIGAGIRYSSLGPTHHALEDLALMRVLPHMTVLSPADPLETSKAIKAAAKIDGPVYIRIGTSKEPSIYKEDYAFEVGKGVVLKEGTDVAIIATGNPVHDSWLASEALEKKGLSVRLINIHTVKPIDKDLILKAAEETKAIVTVEQHNIIGGLGSAVAEVLAEKCSGQVVFERIGFNDQFCLDYGGYDELKDSCGIGPEGIVNRVLALGITKK